jgi:hypothetical protein
MPARRFQWPARLGLCVLVLSGAVIGDDERPVDPIAGAWERTVTTPQGAYRFVKSHLDGKTTLHVTGPDGTVVESKASEYRVSETEAVRVFTYFNNVVTAGPNAGQRAAGESSYIYRIDGDRFYEIHGLLKSDDGPVQVIVWNRVQEEAQ